MMAGGARPTFNFWEQKNRGGCSTGNRNRKKYSRQKSHFIFEASS